MAGIPYLTACLLPWQPVAILPHDWLRGYMLQLNSSTVGPVVLYLYAIDYDVWSWDMYYYADGADRTLPGHYHERPEFAELELIDAWGSNQPPLPRMLREVA